jgi:hypothetical protein
MNPASARLARMVSAVNAEKQLNNMVQQQWCTIAAA